MSEFVVLDQLRLTTGDDVERTVTEQFPKQNFVLRNLPFHFAAVGSGSSAQAYTWTQESTQVGGSFRALNADYSGATADVETKTVVCKRVGEKFFVDRSLGSGAQSQIELQINSLTKGISATWTNAFINGDSDAITGDVDEFDGLAVMLDGGDNDVDGTGVDFSAIATVADALEVLASINALISKVDGQPTALFANSDVLQKIEFAAKLAGYLTAAESAAGTPVLSYRGVQLVDLGAKGGSNDAIIPVTTHKSDIYVARFATDGVFGVAPADGSIVRVYTPNLNTGSATGAGAVELVSAVAMKTAKSAAVLKGVTVTAA